MPLSFVILLIIQLQRIVFKLEDFVLEVRADPQHQTLPFLDSDMQVFGFVMDILLPKVCIYMYVFDFLILTKFFV